MGRVIKVKGETSYKKALANMKKLAISAEKGWRKEKSLMAKFQQNKISKADSKKLEKIISQTLKNDRLKIDQYKQIDAYRRKHQLV